MIQFIDKHPDCFSIEFICKTLNTHRKGGFITSRGYRQSKARGLSSRRLRDVALVERIREVHAENYGVYGVRKMWHALRRQGIDIGREQTARLMRLAGVAGKGKGGSLITTRKPKGPDIRLDLVKRDFTAHKPNRLWVGRYYLRANPKRLCVHRFCHRCVLPSHCRLGLVGFDADRSIAFAGTEPSDCVR